MLYKLKDGDIINVQRISYISVHNHYVILDGKVHIPIRDEDIEEIYSIYCCRNFGGCI